MKSTCFSPAFHLLAAILMTSRLTEVDVETDEWRESPCGQDWLIDGRNRWMDEWGREIMCVCAWERERETARERAGPDRGRHSNRCHFTSPSSGERRLRWQSLHGVQSSRNYPRGIQASVIAVIIFFAGGKGTEYARRWLLGVFLPVRLVSAKSYTVWDLRAYTICFKLPRRRCRRSATPAVREDGEQESNGESDLPFVVHIVHRRPLLLQLLMYRGISIIKMRR